MNEIHMRALAGYMTVSIWVLSIQTRIPELHFLEPNLAERALGREVS